MYLIKACVWAVYGGKMKGKDLTGQRFGRLIVIKCIGRSKDRQKLWLCRCDCGKLKETKTSYLTSGDTTSCGCYRREKLFQEIKGGDLKDVQKQMRVNRKKLVYWLYTVSSRERLDRARTVRYIQETQEHKQF